MFSSSAVKLTASFGKVPSWHVSNHRSTHCYQGCFSMFQIKPCAIREDLHRRKYQNHHSVIYGKVKQIHGTVEYLSVPSALQQNSKPDRVLL